MQKRLREREARQIRLDHGWNSERGELEKKKKSSRETDRETRLSDRLTHRHKYTKRERERETERQRTEREREMAMKKKKQQNEKEAKVVWRAHT